MLISWMLYAVAMSLLVTGVARACAGICTLYRLPTRWCWMMALACSIAAPLIARSVPARVQDNALRLTAVTYDVIDAASGPPRPVGTAAHAAASITPTTIAAAGWIVASATLLLALVAATARLHGARRSWRREVVCGERVLVSADIGPAVIGLRRHEIVLPAWALELGDTELGLAVAHEREHVIAHDPWLLFAALLAVAIAPWNPALWIQLHQLRRAVEGDCDARVLAHTRDTRRYATLLMAVGQRRSSARAPVLALSYPTSILEWRIRTMTNRTPSHRPARAIACTALVGALAAAAVLLPRPGMSQSYQITATQPAQVTADTGTKSAHDSLSASLAATRDTLATLRGRMHIEPGVVYHVTLQNGRVSGAVAPPMSPSAYPRANVSVATVQAAIASHFPDAAAATPNHKRVFVFIVDSAGHVKQSRADTTFLGATNALTGAENPGNFSSMQVLKNVPFGSDSVSVLWMVKK